MALGQRIFHNSHNSHSHNRALDRSRRLKQEQMLSFFLVRVFLKYLDEMRDAVVIITHHE